MGDKLLLNFGIKDQHKFIISHVKITKSPWQMFGVSQCQDGVKVL